MVVDRHFLPPPDPPRAHLRLDWYNFPLAEELCIAQAAPMFLARCVVVGLSLEMELGDAGRLVGAAYSILLGTRPVAAPQTMREVKTSRMVRIWVSTRRGRRWGPRRVWAPKCRAVFPLPPIFLPREVFSWNCVRSVFSGVILCELRRLAGRRGQTQMRTSLKTRRRWFHDEPANQKPRCADQFTAIARVLCCFQWSRSAHPPCRFLRACKCFWKIPSLASGTSLLSFSLFMGSVLHFHSG